MCSIYCKLYAISALLFSPITSGALLNGIALIASVLFYYSVKRVKFSNFQKKKCCIEHEIRMKIKFFKRIATKSIFVQMYLFNCCQSTIDYNNYEWKSKNRNQIRLFESFCSIIPLNNVISKTTGPYACSTNSNNSHELRTIKTLQMF